MNGDGVRILTDNLQVSEHCLVTEGLHLHSDLAVGMCQSHFVDHLDVMGGIHVVSGDLIITGETSTAQSGGLSFEAM